MQSIKQKNNKKIVSHECGDVLKLFKIIFTTDHVDPRELKLISFVKRDLISGIVLRN